MERPPWRSPVPRCAAYLRPERNQTGSTRLMTPRGRTIRWTHQYRFLGGVADRLAPLPSELAARHRQPRRQAHRQAKARTRFSNINSEAMCHRRSTERRANGQFLLASLGTHQEQVGYIRASDQQHKADAAHQNPQELAHVAHHMLLQRRAGSAPFARLQTS